MVNVKTESRSNEGADQCTEEPAWTWELTGDMHEWKEGGCFLPGSHLPIAEKPN